MTPQSMSFIFGAILLAVAILGGGFEVKEIKVSNVSVGVRIIAGIVGLIFVGLGFLQLPSALTQSASGSEGSAAEPARISSRPPPKPAEALVAEQVPFISDRDRIDVGALYLPAPDHKALAVSHSRIGMITGQADIETAKNGALDNCRQAVEAAESTINASFTRSTTRSSIEAGIRRCRPRRGFDLIGQSSSRLTARTFPS